ncbi:hypothetical protein MBLNU230_g5346t1 [Neophaeotheca triangularis]
MEQVPDKVTSGKALPGTKLRVCDPTTGALCERGVDGELWMSGSMVLSGYWSQTPEESNKVFVEVEGERWLKTGDQAIMHKDGAIQIVGRYKHLIIRGGENISPKYIEDILIGKFGLQSDFVGLPDEVAGEVPVAVTKAAAENDVPFSSIQETLIKHLGQGYALQETIRLDALELTDFPKTASGMVQKNVLQERLVKNMERASQADAVKVQDGASGATAEQVTDIWRNLLGVDKFTTDNQVSDWADSLVVARFPGVLRRRTGLQITVQEIAAHNTPAAQPELLNSRSQQTEQSAPIIELPSGPTRLEEMVHAHGNHERFERTRRLCEELMSPMGSDWDDVQYVLPMYSFQKRFLQKRRPQSNNHRHAFVADGGSVKDCQIAVEKALSQHDMLRTLAIRFDEDTPLHVIVRPSEKLWKHCIIVAEPVDTAEDLKRLLWNNQQYDFAAFPSPLFRVALAHVKEENCAGIVYMAQHSTFDGISLPFFLEDLDALISGKDVASLAQRVPFKAWIDSEYMLRHSQSSKLAVDWNVSRLRGCGTKKNCLFPKQRAPEWFKGDSTAWLDLSTGKPGPSRTSLTPGGDGVTGLSNTCDLPDTQTLKQKHGIDTSTVMEVALALLNTKLTGGDTALFAQYQASRTWPHLQEWQISRLPPAMEVDGPMVQAIVVAIKTTGHDSVLELLQKAQTEQGELTANAHAPFDDVVAQLNSDGSGDGDVMVDALRRQIFNWLPSSRLGDFQSLRKIQQVSRTDVGILWNVMQLSATQVAVMPSWDDAQLTPSEVEDMLAEVIRLAEALASEANWRSDLGELRNGAI